MAILGFHNQVDDVVFEMELVKQVEVNIDYILMLVTKYHDGNCEDKEILVAIDKAIKSSLQLRSKKELIENFIATINAPLPAKRERKSATPTSSVPWYWKKVRSNT